jgi:hypothetical protein
MGGRRRWYVPDAFLPDASSHEVESHECACILNPGGEDARVTLCFFFESDEPVGPHAFVVRARRSLHLRLTGELSGFILPRGVPFGYVVESDLPIIVQHSRLDTSLGAYTFGTTMAYGE